MYALLIKGLVQGFRIEASHMVNDHLVDCFRQRTVNRLTAA